MLNYEDCIKPHQNDWYNILNQRILHYKFEKRVP